MTRAPIRSDKDRSRSPLLPFSPQLFHSPFRRIFRRAFRTLLRSSEAAVLVLVALGLGFGLLLRQPVFSPLAYRAGGRSDPAALRRHVEFLCDASGRGASPRDSDHPENLDRAAAYIARTFAASGARVSEQPFSARGKTYRNVVARFGPPGRHPLVVGAHYDSFGDFGANPGADDNASGTAGLLELARLLGASRAGLQNEVQLVAYTNEEPPYFASQFMGSAVHARSLHTAGTPPAGMICLEMIGTFTERQPWTDLLSRLLFPRDGRFVALVGRWPDRALTRRIKSAFLGSRGGDGSVRAVSYNGPEIPGIDASDHRSYWAAGDPAVMVTDTAFLRNPRYHTAADRPETLDYRRMADVVDGVANAVMWLSGRKGKMPY